MNKIDQITCNIMEENRVQVWLSKLNDPNLN